MTFKKSPRLNRIMKCITLKFETNQSESVSIYYKHFTDSKEFKFRKNKSVYFKIYTCTNISHRESNVCTFSHVYKSGFG